MLSAAPATSVTSTSTSTSTTSTSTSTLTSSAAPLLSTASVSSALSSAPSSFCPVFASESPLLSNMVAALPASSPHLTNAMSNHVSSFTTSTTIPSPKLPPRPATAFPATSEHLSANYLAASPSSSMLCEDTAGLSTSIHT
ncbi:hypothetical protein BC829DRAFT_448131 [Chytridium lagenaria]|nr:hypothetical protein BC829DRAFT_448131 [Chytridium lagenaria]